MKQESIYQKKLKKLRKEIDKQDSKILSLLSKRFTIVRKVGLLKKTYGEKVHDPNREKTILLELIHKNQRSYGVITSDGVRRIYKTIISCAKHAEKDLQQS